MASPESLTMALDACCFLLTITGEEPGASDCAQLLDAAWDDAIQLVESPAILVEVPPRHRNDGGRGKRELVLAQLDSSKVNYIDLTTIVARKAADITVSYPQIRNLDAIHLATAVVGGAQYFVTANTRDFPVGQLVDGVRIVTPEDAVSTLRRGEQPTLFEAPAPNI